VVAAVIGEEPTEMEPSTRVIDPDVLIRSIFGDGGIQVEFEYEEQPVTVTGYGEVIVG